jgi:hypothetical protein
MHEPRVFITVTTLIWLAACAPTPDRIGSTSVEPIPSSTHPACQPSQIQLSKNGFPEIQGTMKSNGEIWALLFFDKAYAKKDEKIVWKITGTGKQFDIQAQHKDGTIIHPIWGPEYHVSSNWDRPGNEWGTGFNFPEPGCWTLTVTLGETIGEIRLDVLTP